MYQRSDVIYVYDGTFDGFLNCVYTYYYSSFNPISIISEDDVQASFYQQITIETDFEKAKRVKTAIQNKISKNSIIFLQQCLLSYQENKELHMLKYVAKGFKVGHNIDKLVADEDVNFLLKAHRHIHREKHLYLGVVRFYKSGEVYISEIKPKNQILPLIANHFVERYNQQSFMIYDRTNGQALIHEINRTEILSVNNIELPHIDDDEYNMQKLWKLFYDTIAIKERYNPRCRMNNMPKRTWDMLPEMNENI